MDEIIKGTKFSKFWYKDIREITTIKGMLRESATLYHDKPAFWVKGQRGGEYKAIDYALLQHDVNALGSAFTAHGFKGRKIAVMGEGSYEWIASYLAVICGEGIVVPVDRELGPDEIDNVLRASDCTTFVCSSKTLSKVEGLDRITDLIVTEFYGDRTDEAESPAPIKTDLMSLRKPGRNVYSWRELLLEGDRILASGDTSFEDIEIDPDALAVILFTSGTTGNPKGVMLSNRNITSNIMDVCRIAHIYTWDKTLSILPIHHTYECTLGMLLVLYRGASTAFCEGLKYIIKNMQEAHNTVFIAVPRMLEMIHDNIMKKIEKAGKLGTIKGAMNINRFVRHTGIDLSRMMFRQIYNGLGGKLRMFIAGAAALDPQIYRDFEDCGVTILEGYGMTECTPLISGTPQAARTMRYKKAGSVGTVVDHGEVKIIDKDQNGIGEVLFKGPNVMLGYYNMPEETAETIEDGWLHTGDLGYVDKDGWLYLTGRKKNVIVTDAGENIYPEEVEDYLNKSPYIADCMVYAAGENEDIVGVQIYPDLDYIKEKEGREPGEEELQDLIEGVVKELNTGLSPFKRIRRVYVRDEDFVRTTTQKIKRHENVVEDK
ncbi:MAG: AMP-dependent synthetase/ligase [Anaerovoracaceae bacterium]